jgi:2TM domain
MTIDKYKQEDVQQILQIAIARSQSDEFTRKQLLEIAEELNISSENLALAEQEWLSLQTEQQKRLEFNIYQRKKLSQKLVKYAIVNSFLILLNLVSAGKISWSLYIIILWAIPLVLTAWRTYQKDSEEYEQMFQRWYRNTEIKKTFNNFVIRFLKGD